MIDAYPGGFAPGGVELHSVMVDDAAADWGVQGTDDATLRVGCDLAPGVAAVFRFDYELILPDALGMVGTGASAGRLAGFYPLPAVWDGGFHVERVGPVGESLMADPMDYRATVTCRTHGRWRRGADARAERAGAARQNVTVTLSNARCFALALSRR
jgi:hypothetical protein